MGIFDWFNRDRHAGLRAAGESLAAALGAREGAPRKGTACSWYEGEHDGHRYAFTFATIRRARGVAGHGKNVGVLRLVLASSAPVPAGLDVVHGFFHALPDPATFEAAFHMRHEADDLPAAAWEAMLDFVRSHPGGFELVDRDKAFKSSRPADGWLDEATALVQIEVAADEHTSEQAQALLDGLLGVARALAT